jgi:hypothetical protein
VEGRSVLISQKVGFLMSRNSEKAIQGRTWALELQRSGLRLALCFLHGDLEQVTSLL